jgi:putative polyketide hydroxylase
MSADREREPEDGGRILVVGGGTVGLSVAVALTRHGVPPLVVERHAGTSIHPRATGVQPPAKEFFRSMGLAERMREASADLAPSRSKIDITSLAGDDLSAVPRVPTPPPAMVEVTARISPTDAGPCAQDQIDGVLLEAATAGGVDVRFGTELVDVAQDADGVTATVRERDTGRRYRIRAEYLVAADGSASRVRELLGIGMTGPEKLSRPMINLLCRVDLADLVRGHEFAFAEVRNPSFEGLLLTINNRDRWVFHLTYDPDEETADDYPPQRCRDLVRAALGLPDAPVEVLARLPWQMSARIADRIRQDRIFLVGDAGHVIPPVAAFGMSTGIADAYNLAWKLALVVTGRAGPRLLDSYEPERLPVARLTCEQALLRFQNLDLHFDAARSRERTRLRMADPLVTGIGYQYVSGAVVDPRPELPSLEDVERNLDGSPGSRVPHAWLDRAGREVSTLDLAGTGFALIAGPDGADWCDAARAFAGRTGVPLTTHRVGADGLTDPTGRWLATAGLQPAGALLVRPDNFVAWRSPGPCPEPGAALERALDEVLDRAALALTR